MAEIKIDKETEEQIKELQLTEQSLQAQLLQKQAFQIEFNETEAALNEIKNAKSDEIYKIAGQIMLKADKKDIEKELNEKKDLLNLRINSIEKQEKLVQEKLAKLQEDISKKLKSKK